MSSNETFEIFGFDHIFTIVLILGISIIIPYLLKGYSRKDLRLFSLGLATIIVLNEFGKPFYYPYLYPDLYEFFEMLPFHMCHLSSFSISIFLLTNKKVFFNLAFFWGIGGCSMALTQPDVPYKFPDANFLLYFFSHGLLFFAIMLSTITFKNRPYFNELINVVLISLPVVGTIYVINLTINSIIESSPANYWYLIRFPDGANLTALMPDPPLHLPIFFVLGLFVFGLIYFPFYIYDRFFANNL